MSMFIVFLILVSGVHADLIMSGYKGISIENRITNLQTYPDYVFISLGELGVGMCPVRTIGQNGTILPYYKYCDVSVWAIKKSGLPQGEIDLEMLNTERQESISEAVLRVNSYLGSVHAKKVLEKISTYTTIPESSPETVRRVEYTVSIDSLKTQPSSVYSKRDSTFIVYLIISLLAFIAIVLRIMWRKK